MKTKNYIIAAAISIALTIVFTIIIALIQSPLSINTYVSGLIIGWLGASAYSITLNIMKNKFTLNTDTDNITTDMTKIDDDDIYENNISKSELDKCKEDLEYLKSKYDNLKSDMIVQNNIK